MAVKLLPTDYIAAWSEDATNVTFPIASIANLSAAEADAASGDMRKVLYDFMENLYTKYSGFATADKPVNMVIRKASIASDTAIKRQYIIEFTNSFASENVADEPA